MRKLMLAVSAVLAVVALTSIAAATASAAAPEFLPTLNSFTSTSGAGTLQIKGGNTVECTSDTDEGKVTGSLTVTTTVEFLGCLIFKIVGAHSTGDAEGTILVKGSGELCFINKAKEEVALALAVETLTVEAVGAKSEITGTVLGKVNPVNKLTLGGELIYKQTGGAQEIERCEGGATLVLSASENGGAAKQAGEQTTDKITYTEKEEEVTA